MEVTTIIIHKGAHAHFKILRESPGIYDATLLDYEGLKRNSPPSGIVLTRGLRQWTGSCDDKILIAQIGQAIEEHLLKVSAPAPAFVPKMV